MEKLNLALNEICQSIGGEWLLLGGSLVAFDVDPERGTEDIDLVPLGSDDNQNELAKLVTGLHALGINPEQLNSAASFYVQQVKGWRYHVVSLKKGRAGKIFRPDLTLFTLLKCRRGTPVDLNDVRVATKKWGRKEFNRDAYFSWATTKEIALAQDLGLID